jgi:hypothetical protein
MAVVGRLKYAICSGNKARLRMCRLQATIDEDDLPPEDIA